MRLRTSRFGRKGFLALWTASCCLALVSCASRPADKERSFPKLATTADAGCNRKDSVELYELKDPLGNDHDRELPLQVPPGTYSIGASCAWVFSHAQKRCIDVRKLPAASSKAYPLILKSNVDYVYSCSQMIVDESGKYEVTMIVGKKEISIDATYDLRLTQNNRRQTND